jgi:hypothetical protein
MVSSGVDVLSLSAYPPDSERTICKATTSVAICICSALHPTALRGNGTNSHPAGRPLVYSTPSPLRVLPVDMVIQTRYPSCHGERCTGYAGNPCHPPKDSIY